MMWSIKHQLFDIVCNTRKVNKIIKTVLENSLPAIEGHETVISVSVLQPASYAGLSWVNLG